MFFADPKPAFAPASNRGLRVAPAKLIRKSNSCVEEPAARALLFDQRAASNPAADPFEVPFSRLAQYGCLCDLREHCEIGATEHCVPSDVASSLR
jgi:hypothetical protein